MSYKNKIYILLYLFISSNSYAQTNVSGTISSTTWSASNGPYIVIDDILLQEGSTLTIEAGTTVKFLADKKFQIKGTLVARGTSSSKITFTSNETSPSAGDWKYIQFYDESTDASFSGTTYTGGSILEYCIVEYGQNSVNINSASPYLHQSEFRYSSSTGISGGGSTIRINNCDIHHNAKGISISSGSNSIIDYNIIRDNSPNGGGSVNANFSYNTIKNNTLSNSKQGSFVRLKRWFY